MRLRTARIFFSGSIFISVLAGAVTFAQEPRIAVIMDDVGNQLDAGRRSVALPGPVALAILPYAPFARRLAEEGNQRGKEILVHMPMQASHVEADPGPGSLIIEHDRRKVGAILANAVASVPYASGVSNHMGSLLTRDPQAMRSFMLSLVELDGLFFLDSYTTHLSVGLMTAREYGIPSLKRDVFLDADPSSAGLDAAWERLLEQARIHGFAVAIAHPYELTLDTLERRIQELDDILLVSPRELLGRENARQRSYAESIGYAPTNDFAAGHRIN